MKSIDLVDLVNSYLGPKTNIICELFLKYVDKESKYYNKTDKINFAREYARVLIEFEKFKVNAAYAKDLNDLANIFVKKKHDAITADERKYLLQALEKSKSTLSRKFSNDKDKEFLPKFLSGAGIIGGIGASLATGGGATLFTVGGALLDFISMFVDTPEKEKDIDKALKTGIRAAIDRSSSEKEFKDFIAAILAKGHKFGHNFNITVSDIAKDLPSSIGKLLTTIADPTAAKPSDPNIINAVETDTKASLKNISKNVSDSTNTTEKKLAKLKEDIDLANEAINLGTLLLNDLVSPDVASTFNIIASNTADIAYSTARFFLGDIGLTRFALTTAKGLFFIGQAIFGKSTDSADEIYDEIYNETYPSVEKLLSDIKNDINKLHANQIKIIESLQEMLKLLKDGNEEVMQGLLRLEINIIDYIQEDNRFHEMDKLDKSADRLKLLLALPKDQFSESFFNHYLMNIHNYALRTAKSSSFSGYTTQDLKPETWIAQVEKKDRIDLIFGMLHQLAQVNAIKQNVQYERLARLITNETIIPNPIEWLRGASLFMTALAYRQANDSDFNIEPYISSIHALKKAGEQINKVILEFTNETYITEVESKLKNEISKQIEGIDSSLVTSFLKASYIEFSKLNPKLSAIINEKTFCHGYEASYAILSVPAYQVAINHGPYPMNKSANSILHYTILRSALCDTLHRKGNKYFFDNITGKPFGYRLFELENIDILNLITFAEKIGLVKLITVKTTLGIDAVETSDMWPNSIKYNLTEYSIHFIVDGFCKGLVLSNFYGTISQSNPISCYYFNTSWRDAINKHFKSDVSKIVDIMPDPLNKNFNFEGITFIDFLYIQINRYIASLRVDFTSEIPDNSNILDQLINKSQILQLSSYLRLLVQLRSLCLSEEITAEDLSLSRTCDYYSKNDLLRMLIKIVLHRDAGLITTKDGARLKCSLKDSKDIMEYLIDTLQSSLESYFLSPLPQLIQMCKYFPDYEPQGLPLVDNMINAIDIFLDTLSLKAAISYESSPKAGMISMKALPVFNAHSQKPVLLSKPASQSIQVKGSSEYVRSIFGLDYKKVPGDHHCLYHAVSYYLNKNPKTKSEKDFVTDLRNEIADHIRDNLKEYEIVIRNELRRNPNTYIESVRKEEWAGDVEISALMKIHQRPIFVLGRAEKSPYLKLLYPHVLNSYPGALPIFIYYNGVNHYDALIPNGVYPLGIIIEFFRWQHSKKYPLCSKFGRNQNWPELHSFIKQNKGGDKILSATFGLFWATFHNNEHEIKWFREHGGLDNWAFMRKDQDGEFKKYVIKATDVVSTNYFFKTRSTVDANSKNKVKSVRNMQWERIKQSLSDGNKRIRNNEFSPKNTEGYGDCVFHAIFGKWNGNLFYCDDVFQKRKELARQIRSCRTAPNLYNLVKEAIKALIIENKFTGSIIITEAQSQYQEYARAEQVSMKSAWNKFYLVLKKYPNVIEFIDNFCEKHRANKSILLPSLTINNSRFQTCLNQIGNDLRNMILSVPELNKALIQYNDECSAEFNWQSIYTNSDVIYEYANFIEKLGSWLIPVELQIIGYVFNITIDYYIKASTMPHTTPIKIDTYNPGKSSTVSVCFNGVNHYEKMASQDQLMTIGEVSREVGQTQIGANEDNLIIRLLLEGTVTNHLKNNNPNYEKLHYVIDNDSIKIHIIPAISDAFQGSEKEKENAQLLKREKIVKDIKQSLVNLINFDDLDNDNIKVSLESRMVTLSPVIIGMLNGCQIKSKQLLEAIEIVETIRILQSKPDQLLLVQKTIDKILNGNNCLFGLEDDDKNQRKHICIRHNDEDFAQHLRDALRNGLSVTLKLNNNENEFNKIFRKDGLGSYHSISCSINDFIKHFSQYQNYRSMCIRK
jgi:hypothetical protein